MAQPILENGDPLEEYLKESGEVIPGDLPQDNHDDSWDSWPIRILRSLIYHRLHLQYNNRNNAFADRFKHDVISSSLLSSTPFSIPHHRTNSPSLVLPGTLHSREPSTGTTQDIHSFSQPSNNDRPRDSYNYGLASIAFLPAVILFAAGFYTLTALLLGGGTFYLIHFHHPVEHQNQNAPSPGKNMESLNDLISAGILWDSVVHEAITLLESEERTIFYGPSTPLSPSSSLRVALQSSLYTTQTQCDHIRALFSALTLPQELSQLSEMYAPPSPMKPTFFAAGLGLDHPRPSSLPGLSRTVSLSPTKLDTKRFTWNGSVESANTTLRRQEKKRMSDFGSDEQEDLDLDLDLARSKSAPVTPLIGVEEEYINRSGNGEISSFGMDALNLQRKHKRDGLGVFGVPIPHPSTPHRKTASGSTVGTPSSASKFTTMQTTRHPLSLFALHHSLQSAIAAKRYACSHLLALRFDEGDVEGEDEEGYWEDVRSVMGLLTGTLGDAANRLVEAVDEAEEKRRLEQNPTPKSSLGDVELEMEENLSRSPLEKKKIETVRSMKQMMSFAPMPSHLTRFAAHVDAISSAMNDARDNLEQCVTSLQEDARYPSSQAQEDPALQAYERLRRELGLALRECERGRERLLDLIAASNPSPGSEEEEDELHDLPAFGQDMVGSDESDKPDSYCPPMLDFERFGADDRITVVSGEGLPEDDDVDDASAHLLRMASSKYLPPQGIEQVFEAEPDPVVTFMKEKSKLTREERIKMMKARREGSHGLTPSPPSGDTATHSRSGRESWGPGEDVVQELKDVIWQVGEKRRKMTVQLETAP